MDLLAMLAFIAVIVVIIMIIGYSDSRTPTTKYRNYSKLFPVVKKPQVAVKLTPELMEQVLLNEKSFDNMRKGTPSTPPDMNDPTDRAIQCELSRQQKIDDSDKENPMTPYVDYIVRNK